MRVGLLVLLAAAGLGVTDKPDKKKKTDPVPKEIKNLEGTWTLAEIKNLWLAHLLPDDHDEQVIKGNKCTLILRSKPGVSPERKYQFIIKTNPRKKPKTIDLIQGRTIIRGIFQLDGAGLNFWEPTPGAKRPTPSDITDGRCTHWTWKRTKG
jgi:uncharacterized protein (TIGR03067 family)